MITFSVQDTGLVVTKDYKSEEALILKELKVCNKLRINKMQSRKCHGKSITVVSRSSIKHITKWVNLVHKGAQMPSAIMNMREILFFWRGLLGYSRYWDSSSLGHPLQDEKFNQDTEVEENLLNGQEMHQDENLLNYLARQQDQSSIQP